MSSPPDTATNSNRNNATDSKTNTIDVSQFCTVSVPDFTPLGGSRPDAAVVACVAVSEQGEEEAKKDVILPPDVLDTALAMLCAPLIVRHAEELRGREAHFQCHTATVRLHTTDEDAEDRLRTITADMPNGGLSVMVVLEEAVSELRDSFMVGWKDRDVLWEAFGRVDLRRTSLRRIGSIFLFGCSSLSTVTFPPSLTVVADQFLFGCRRLQCLDLRHTAVRTVGEGFAYKCSSLTTVTFPPCLTEVGCDFLRACESLQCLDMGHTAVHTVGRGFAARCSSLTTMMLPDAITEVGPGFLLGCGRVEVSSGSTAVQAAAVEH